MVGALVSGTLNVGMLDPFPVDAGGSVKFNVEFVRYNTWLLLLLVLRPLAAKVTPLPTLLMHRTDGVSEFRERRLSCTSKGVGISCLPCIALRANVVVGLAGDALPLMASVSRLLL